MSTYTYFDCGDVETLTLQQLADWRIGKSGQGSCLHLPPIQRTLVWRNAQIINYWDSLLRGYPAGLFLVHRAGDAKGSNAEVLGGDQEGKSRDINPEDFQLFDGQQRMSTILLGLGKGQLTGKLKLWVDLAADARIPDDLVFPLRISSVGQPYGYRAGEPNSKFGLSERMQAAKADAGKVPSEVFSDNRTIISANWPVPFSWICDRVILDVKLAEILEELRDNPPSSEAATPPILTDDFAALHNAVRKAFTQETVVRKLPVSIVSDPKEYVRFFRRLGQGGTALTDDELTYSILKNSLPHIRDRMGEISEKSLMLASEVDLVLAALRLARLEVARKNPQEGISVGRPTPAFAFQIVGAKSENTPESQLNSEIRESFLKLIPQKVDGDFQFLSLLQGLRNVLVKDEPEKGDAPLFPPVLLARLHREALDMLLLLQHVDNNEGHLGDGLLPFTLYLLLVLDKPDRAADELFRAARGTVDEPDEVWLPSPGTLQTVVKKFENQGYAPSLLSVHDFEKLRKAAQDQGRVRESILLPELERFSAADQDRNKPECGHWLRTLVSNPEKTKRALLWLQRDYLKKSIGTFDPLSSHDEDLPLDLDHLIPSDLFAFNWNNYGKRPAIFKTIEKAEADNFNWQRRRVGNALGNFRWLHATDNRRRKNNEIKEDDNMMQQFLLEDVGEWNRLINKGGNKWALEDVARFQELIDLRCLFLAEILVRDMKVILPFAKDDALHK